MLVSSQNSVIDGLSGRLVFALVYHTKQIVDKLYWVPAWLRLVAAELSVSLWESAQAGAVVF